ncbi:hypothetical protein [Cellulomonas sp. URHB0016]
MRWWERRWQPVATFLVLAGMSWAGGLRSWSPVLVGLAGAALAVVLLRIDAEPEPRWARPAAPRLHGVRGDVQDLAWTMVGRDKRVGEWVLRRLRLVATTRLARHGLRLGAAEDDGAVEALVGQRAFTTLTRYSSPLPTLPDVRHTLDVLEALGTDRPTTPRSTP